MANSNLLEEYKDISANLRHYSNMRFKQLTLFVALTGAIITVLSGDNLLATGAKISFKILGLLVAIIFWVMEERACDYWHRFVGRAVDIEKELDFKQYTNRPTRRIFTATNAARLLYFLILLFWLQTMLCPQFYFN